MPNWNSGYIFNAQAQDNGFMWNGANYFLLLNLNEILSLNDNISLELAKIIISEQNNLIYDSLINLAFFNVIPDQLFFKDTSSCSALFNLMDSLDLKDIFSDLIVFAYLHDKQNIIDEARFLSNHISCSDDININEISTIESLMQVMDKYNLNDLMLSIEYLFTVYDRFGITDHTPKTAITDFLIGSSDEYDIAYDWLLPFGLKVDWNTSSIQVMPETEITSIEMPGIDGSIVEDTVYKDRLFQIVAYSELGLTAYEKESLKSKITEILDSTKHKSKSLTIQKNDISFDARYDGFADIKDGPSYVKASIPFRVSPYGRHMFTYEFIGSGLVDNSDGATDLGVIHTIKGPISNPTFEYNEKKYIWNGALSSSNESLIINHSLMTCYTIDVYGNKTNALSKLNGTFQKIKAGGSGVVHATGETEKKMKTEYSPKIIW